MRAHARTLDHICARNSHKKERSNSLPTGVTAILVPKACNGHFVASYYKRMLFKCILRCARTYTYMHVRAIANSTRKRTQTQINACKRIAAIDVWAISARKRDCVLRVESKTFGMYYTYVFYKT